MLQYQKTLWQGFALLVLSSSCTKSENDVALSRANGVPDVPVPAADGPELGATAFSVPVHVGPGHDTPLLGLLHAGARVPRAETPYSHDGCEQGWYPIRPRGFVCLDDGATTDMQHPTLATMAIQPNLDAPLPYTYARTHRDAHFWLASSAQERTVQQDRSLTSRSGGAVVGSWEATDAQGNLRRLAMLTSGRFLDVTDLEEAKVSDFKGVALSEAVGLPVGFIVKRGVAAWDIDGPTFKRKRELRYHETIHLTGRHRDVKEARYWEASDGLWVRHQDMTTARARSKPPEFVKPGQRWVDISIIAGTMVAYEGSIPVYASLVSVGRDRLTDDVPDARVTKRGEFTITAKHVTALGSDVKGFANRVEMHDVPWVLKLSSGQLLHGAYWHNRFGIEHGPGNVQLSPADAHWLFHWAGPAVPKGWHAVVNTELRAASDDAQNADVVPILPVSATPESTIINIRK